MYKGTIIENSLADKSILKKIQILRTWQSDDWTLHDVLVKEADLGELAQFLDDGPWYMHFWKPGEDKVFVLYKDKIFSINYSDKTTWKDAVEYGKALGIPESQLTFVIN